MPSTRLTRRTFVGSLPTRALIAFTLPLSQMPGSVATATPATTPSASPGASASPSIAPDVVAAYTLDVALNTETNLLTGMETITWHNTTGQEQDILHLRLYPNATYYGDAETTLSQVEVDGTATAASLRTSDSTVASISLGRTVAVGDQVRIDLAFVTRVPLGAAGSFGIFGVDMERGSWALADWYPILAGWEPERGDWYLDAPTPFGDPTFAETSTYTLTLEAPETFALVSTGTLVTQTAGSSDATIPTAIRRVDTGPVREFAMALLPTTNAADGELRHDPPGNQIATPLASPAGAGPVDPTVTLALYADEDIPGLTDAILAAATTALPRYRELLGPLQEESLEIASAHLAGANGVSWPGMIWLDLTILARDGALGEEERPGLRFTVTHEVGHQWVGGLLGLNSNDHGFMLEGLTNALAIGAIRDSVGADAAVEAMGRFVAGPYSGLVRDGRDVIADQPLTAETNVVLRALGVYGKAGLGFEAIRQAMGNDAWRTALATFAGTFRNRVFTPTDLRIALRQAAPEAVDVDALWAFWFEQAKTTLPDIDPIVQGSGH